MSNNLDELRWVRAFSPDLIPKYLVEQIKSREYSVDNFYKYHELNCLLSGKDGLQLNPYNYLYVLADKNNFTKGFLWLVVDPLNNDLVVNTFSVDKEYWGNGKAMKKASSHIKEIMKKIKSNKVYWITNYPKHSERNGFKRSKGVLMEYQEAING